MMRFIGFLTGAAAAIALLVLVLGTPRLPAGPDDGNDAAEESKPAQPTDTEADAGSAAVAAVETGTREPGGASPQATRSTEATAAATTTPDSAPVAAAAAVPTTVGAAAGIATQAPGDPPETRQPEAAWHAFWSPFASRIAADGFVSRLEAVTGFDYRVVRVDTGVYEVAFAYADEAERATRLDAIRQATGLELPDS